MKKPYTREDAEKAVSFLAIQGFDAEIIGSIGRGEESYHDIDLLMTNMNEAAKLKLFEVLQPCGMIQKTDWDGFYFTETRFGDLDIFFNKEDFDY